DVGCTSRFLGGHGGRESRPQLTAPTRLTTFVPYPSAADAWASPRALSPVSHTKKEIMRNLSVVLSAVLGLAAASQAQIVLNLGQPLTSANQGNPGGAVYFNMVLTNTITWAEFQYVSSDATPTTG